MDNQMPKGQSEADKVKESELRDSELEHEAAEEARLHDPEVNYMGPKMGPFKCGNCFFFDKAESDCEHPKVDAPVEAEGCCNLFQNMDESKH